MTTSAHRSVAGAVCLLLAACSCDDKKPTLIPPEIAVRGSADPDAPALAGLAFEEVPVGTTSTKVAVIVSLQPGGLSVGAIRFEDDDGASSAAFTAAPAGPFAIDGTGSASVEVRFAPTEVRPYVARLVIPSDDPNRPEVPIPLTGQGVAGDIRVAACFDSTEAEPQRCRDTEVSAPGTFELGRVIEGQRRTATVYLFNEGRYVLHVTSVRFRDPDAARALGWKFEGNVSVGVDVAPIAADGTVGYEKFGVTLDTTEATAFTPGPVSAEIVVASDDPDESEVSLTVRAELVANSTPQACVYVRSILHRNGSVEEFQPGVVLPTVEPLETVTLDAIASPGCSGDAEDGSLVTQDWTVEGPGATPRLDAVPGEPFQRSIHFEEPGTYTVRVRIIDSLGKAGTSDAAGNPAEVAIEVAPRQDIGVYASWPGDPFVDVDIHLVHGDSTLWASNRTGPSDAYWDNSNPNWGDPGTNEDDPILVIDDVGTGNLVESIELNRPEPGKQYQVHVHFFEDMRNRTGAPDCNTDAECAGTPAPSVCSDQKCMEAVEVRFRVFLLSEEIDLTRDFPSFMNPQALGRPCDDWFVGVVQWPADLATERPQFIPAGAPVVVSGIPSGAACQTP